MNRHRALPRLACGILAMAVTVLLPVSAGSLPNSVTAKPAELELKLMSFNLRYASDEQPNRWNDRRPVMVRVIQENAPDVMGTQEGTFRQLQDLAHDLPVYDSVGLGREGGSRGEFCSIFFRRDRFELIAFDHFWLSDTPRTIGSITWGHRYIRMATWVRLRDRNTQGELIVLNTHFDHEVAAAREKAATLIRDWTQTVDPAIPLVVMGDFNCAAGSSMPFTILTTDSGLTDTWLSAKMRSPESPPNTFHGYQPPLFEGERIDWILVRDSLLVQSAAVLTDHDGGQYPSDHFPVTATVLLPR